MKLITFVTLEDGRVFSRHLDYTQTPVEDIQAIHADRLVAWQAAQLCLRNETYQYVFFDGEQL